MSSATASATTETAFFAITIALGANGPFGPLAQDVDRTAQQGGETWSAESRTTIPRSLDVRGAVANIHGELTRSIEAAVRPTQRAMDQSQRYAGMAADVTDTYTTPRETCSTCDEDCRSAGAVFHLAGCIKLELCPRQPDQPQTTFDSLCSAQSQPVTLSLGFYS